MARITTTARPTGNRATVARDVAYHHPDAYGGIIPDETAMTIASWYMSPGCSGNALAELATTGDVDASDLLDDVHWTIDAETAEDTDERDELLALERWAESRATTYRDVVFMQDSDAVEALDLLDERGLDALWDHVMQWETGEDDGETRDEVGAGWSTRTDERDGYVLSWDAHYGHVGLQRRIVGYTYPD